MVQNQYRNTVYKTLEDPKTHKKTIEIVNYIYDKQAKMEDHTKGRNVDKQA